MKPFLYFQHLFARAQLYSLACTLYLICVDNDLFLVVLFCCCVDKDLFLVVLFCCCVDDDFFGCVDLLLI